MLESFNQHCGIALVDSFAICAVPLFDRILSFPSHDVICRVRCVHDNGRALSECERTFKLVVENLGLGSRTLRSLDAMLMVLKLLILGSRKLGRRLIPVR